ncbi:hypothetical protein ASG31_11870 [Chryseobacterium sp. Leaf404]|uniref:hypothetical protein n=1 Tax=unclassified Chryseobacterium TaxID=2593645 RepID=UPI0006FB4B90|nr:MULTISPECIES: hypothetical protein [unclassified Chryseobacterium]KQT17049.1 hypothetical protein ASG31_11870 [Chryseobacterium sp. Leaf404]
MDITIEEIEKNLRSLPKEFFGQVNDYIDLLKSKAKIETDWADHLTDSQKQSIERGIDDIKNGRTHSHEEAKRKIKQYLLERSK